MPKDIRTQAEAETAKQLLRAKLAELNFVRDSIKMRAGDSGSGRDYIIRIWAVFEQIQILIDLKREQALPGAAFRELTPDEVAEKLRSSKFAASLPEGVDTSRLFSVLVYSYDEEKLNLAVELQKRLAVQRAEEEARRREVEEARRREELERRRAEEQERIRQREREEAERAREAELRRKEVERQQEMERKHQKELERMRSEEQQRAKAMEEAMRQDIEKLREEIQARDEEPPRDDFLERYAEIDRLRKGDRKDMLVMVGQFGEEMMRFYQETMRQQQQTMFQRDGERREQEEREQQLLDQQVLAEIERMRLEERQRADAMEEALRKEIEKLRQEVSEREQTAERERVIDVEIKSGGGERERQEAEQRHRYEMERIRAEEKLRVETLEKQHQEELSRMHQEVLAREREIARQRDQEIRKREAEERKMAEERYAKEISMERERTAEMEKRLQAEIEKIRLKALQREQELKAMLEELKKSQKRREDEAGEGDELDGDEVGDGAEAEDGESVLELMEKIEETGCMLQEVLKQKESSERALREEIERIKYAAGMREREITRRFELGSGDHSEESLDSDFGLDVGGMARGVVVGVGSAAAAAGSGMVAGVGKAATVAEAGMVAAAKVGAAVVTVVGAGAAVVGGALAADMAGGGEDEDVDDVIISGDGGGAGAADEELASRLAEFKGTVFAPPTYSQGMDMPAAVLAIEPTEVEQLSEEDRAELITNLAQRAIDAAIEGLPANEHHYFLIGVKEGGKLNESKREQLQKLLEDRIRISHICDTQITVPRQMLLVYNLAVALKPYMKYSKPKLFGDKNHIKFVLSSGDIITHPKLRKDIEEAISERPPSYEVDRSYFMRG